MKKMKLILLILILSLLSLNNIFCENKWIDLTDEEQYNILQKEIKNAEFYKLKLEETLNLLEISKISLEESNKQLEECKRILAETKKYIKVPVASFYLGAGFSTSVDLIEYFESSSNTLLCSFVFRAGSSIFIWKNLFIQPELSIYFFNSFNGGDLSLSIGWLFKK